MKKIHYQHIGFPRTGTTWLWDSLIKHKDVFFQSNYLSKYKTRLLVSNYELGKENKWQENNIDKLLKDPKEYIDIYKNYDISMNFRPVNFQMPIEVIDKLATYTTHVGLTIRNPYEMYRSWFVQIRAGVTSLEESHKDSSVYKNWVVYKSKLNPNADPENYSDWINFFIDYEFDIVNTVNKWSTFKNNFKIFIYDDLISDSRQFYCSVCDFIGIEPNQEKSNFINETPNDRKVFETYFEFTPEQILRINDQIDELSILLNRDLSKWKKI